MVTYEMKKKGYRNIKLKQEMEFIAHDWKSNAACAHEEDDIKKNIDDTMLYF
jgi:hypothetical protein